MPPRKPQAARAQAQRAAASRAVGMPSYAQQRAQQAEVTRKQQRAHQPIPIPPRRPTPQQRRRSQHGAASQRGRSWWLYGLVAAIVGIMLMCGTLTMGVLLIYGRGVLPGVSSMGVALGGSDVQEAAVALERRWSTLTLTDGDRTWQVVPGDLGLELDSRATAQNAFDMGRGAGNPFEAMAGVAVQPVIRVDANAARIGLYDLAPNFVIAPVNAGVQFVDGQVTATPAIDGWAVDVDATVAQLVDNAGAVLADGTLELVMIPVRPDVTDASPMIAEAERLLQSSLPLRAYDPIRDTWIDLSVPPELWAGWLVATPDSSSPTGLALSLRDEPLRAYLHQQSDALGDGRYIDVDEGVNSVQAALANNQDDLWVRVYHDDRQHTVQAGETIISIAWDYGVPYPWVQQANGGIENISVGQTLTIPSPDNFLEFPVVPNKRIVVSISEQRTRVYENGQLKWDWLSSTGIQSSPTWPGIYQILSHEPNAYASIWNLYMPNFLGVYRPVPGSDFTNGFHGFPTRGGSQLLWTNSLGTRVTYGCILLSDTNVQLLYDWADEGVVVEILP